MGESSRGAGAADTVKAPGPDGAVEGGIRRSGVRGQEGTDPLAATADAGSAIGGSVPAADKAASLAVGEVLDGVYRVDRLIGRGAMGAVYLVEHTALGKQFAAKVVAGSQATDAGAVARLRNEARVTSAIDHENIVNVTHLGQTHDGHLFIVMELLRGEDLRERLERQIAAAAQDPSVHAWLPDEETRLVVEQVLSALSAAHGHGVVHRDLKPDNVFLTKKRERVRAKIVDFGISKIHGATHDDLRLTQTGQLIGTPLYMAPEQSRSTSTVDGRADLYALGVMMYEMVTGHVPFEAGNLYEIIVKHATEPPQPLETFRTDLPPAVAGVILRCLEKDPERRFDSAEEVLAAWNTAWGGALAPGVGTVSDSGGGYPSLELPAVTGVAPRGGAGKWIAALVAVLALGGMAAAFALSQGEGPPPATARVAQATPAAPDPPAAPPPAPSVEAPGAGTDTTAPAEPPTPASLTRRITSDPSEADVFVDGVRVGATPYDLRFEEGQTVAVEVRRPGYREATLDVNADSDPEVEVRLASQRRSSGSRRSSRPELAPR